MTKNLNINLRHSCTHFSCAVNKGFDNEWGILWRTYNTMGFPIHFNSFRLDFRGIYCDKDPETDGESTRVNFFMKESINCRHTLSLRLNYTADQPMNVDYSPDDDSVASISIDTDPFWVLMAEDDPRLKSIRTQQRADEDNWSSSTGIFSGKQSKVDGEVRFVVEDSCRQLEITSDNGQFDRGHGIFMTAFDNAHDTYEWLSLDPGIQVSWRTHFFFKEAMERASQAKHWISLVRNPADSDFTYHAKPSGSAHSE